MDLSNLKFKVMATGMGIGVTKEASMEAFEAQAREMLPSFNKLEELKQELTNMLPDLDEKVEAVKAKKVNHLKQIEDLQKLIDELDILSDDYIETLSVNEAQLAVLSEQEKKFDDLLNKVIKRKESAISEKLVELFDIIVYEAKPEFETLENTANDIVNNRNRESIEQVLANIKKNLRSYIGTFNVTAQDHELYTPYNMYKENVKFQDKRGISRKFYLSF